MVEYDDDDEQQMFEALKALRLYVVTVSSDFGARLAVRLGALAVARDQGDPSVAGLLGSTVLDATNLMVSPFTRDGDDADDPQDADDDEPEEPEDG